MTYRRADFIYFLMLWQGLTLLLYVEQLDSQFFDKRTKAKKYVAVVINQYLLTYLVSKYVWTLYFVDTWECYSEHYDVGQVLCQAVTIHVLSHLILRAVM